MTAIEWTHPPGHRGESWNPVTGCTKVSQGCRHCYAERVFPRAYAATGRKFVDVQTHPERLDAPLKRRAPTCWFVNSMSDLFHAAVSDDFVRAVWTTMAAARRHRFIVLTKRPARMLSTLSAWHRDGLTLREGCGAVLPNVWLGVSCEDQATADERIPLLLQTPAAVRCVSLEPLLGRINLRSIAGRLDYMPPQHDHFDALHERLPNRLDWLIVGGESGPGARPCDVRWIRDIVRQGRAAGVAVFVKQLGARPREDGCEPGHVWIGSGPQTLRRIGDRKGGDPSEWPEDLRVREWPTQERER